jgi:hypothetical protein
VIVQAPPPLLFVDERVVAKRQTHDHCRRNLLCVLSEDFYFKFLNFKFNNNDNNNNEKKAKQTIKSKTPATKTMEKRKKTKRTSAAMEREAEENSVLSVLSVAVLSDCPP